MKKILGLSTLALAGVLAFTGCSCGKDEGPGALPAARLAEDDKGKACYANSYADTCSGVFIATNLYEYLGRDDTVYIDLRDYSDYTGADGHIEGFEMVQFFADIYGGSEDDAKQLFYGSGDKQYAPRYNYSVEVLETIFPKDKNIFLMCAAGGRVVHMMKILELNGWDMTKVYNVGGFTDIAGVEMKEVKDKYNIVKDAPLSATLKTGVDNDTWSGHPYKTIVNLRTDSDGKITAIYVTGSVYTEGAAEGWNPAAWINEAHAYAQKLVGKTLADINTMLGDEGAEGTDVVTGATLTSNRVLRAAKNALTPAA